MAAAQHGRSTKHGTNIFGHRQQHKGKKVETTMHHVKQPHLSVRVSMKKIYRHIEDIVILTEENHSFRFYLSLCRRQALGFQGIYSGGWLSQVSKGDGQWSTQRQNRCRPLLHPHRQDILLQGKQVSLLTSECLCVFEYINMTEWSGNVKTLNQRMLKT
jgi:phospholipase C